MNSALAQLLLLTLLPLHLLSLASRLLHKPLSRRFNAARTVLLLVSIPILLSIIFALPDAARSKNIALSAELEKLKPQVAHLESILQQNAGILNSKVHQLDEEKKLVEALEFKISFLERSVDSLKRSGSSGSSYSEPRISSLEEEVRLLWTESRGNNFDIHMLESEASDAAKNLEAVASEVEKLDNIVTEQWIHIRQLEQALLMAKIRAAEAHKKSALKSQSKGKQMNDKISELINGVIHSFQEVVGLPDSFWLGNPISSSHISLLLDLLRSITTTIQNINCKLQYFVKCAMETNGFTAAFANEVVIYFLASAILFLPLIIGGGFLWRRFMIMTTFIWLILVWCIQP